MSFFMNSMRILLDREPAAFAGFVLGGAAFVLPIVAVPIRRKLGFDTTQYSNKAYVPKAPIEKKQQ